MLPGHVVLDQQGRIVEADDSFGTLLLSPVDRLRGRDVLSLTAPADRAECTAAIAGLRATGQPFDIVKRFVRADESLLWVRNSVSQLTIRQESMIVATCTPMPHHERRRTPETLLRSARLQAAMRKAQGSIGDPLLIQGISWSTLLEVYIAEAEGRPIDVASLVDQLQQSARLIQRWVDALMSADILEVETCDPVPNRAKCYRLTAGAVERLEGYLMTFSGEHAH